MWIMQEKLFLHKIVQASPQKWTPISIHILGGGGANQVTLSHNFNQNLLINILGYFK